MTGVGSQIFESLEGSWDLLERRLDWNKMFGLSWSTNQREELRVVALFWALSTLNGLTMHTEEGEEWKIIPDDEYEALVGQLEERFKLIKELEAFRREAE